MKIFDYDNYREYLRDYYSAAKERDKKFSYRFFSRLAGFSSSAAILKVINGMTNLSMEGAEKVSRALKHNSEERDFFINLVQFNQAVAPTQRQHFAEKLCKSRAFRKVHPLKEAQFQYFSNWYNSVIRELVAFSHFKEDPSWIAKRIGNSLTAKEAADSLKLLLDLGLIRRNQEGRLEQTTEHVTTSDEVVFSGAVKCHREYMGLAMDSIDLIPREKRDISSMTMGVSKETAQMIKKKVQEFRKEIVKIVSENNSQVETVYLMNIQLFPVSDNDGGDS